MFVGYCRTSTVEQVAGLEAQQRQLTAAGCTKLFIEQVSSVAERAQLKVALDFVREGDTLVVTRLDRLARSTADLLRIVASLEDKRVGLLVLDFGGAEVDTNSPSGRLMVTMFGALAQFERELMLQRQREGIAKAKAEGRYKGRKPTARSRAAEVLRLNDAGLGATEIGGQLGISRASIYRILAEQPSNLGYRPEDRPSNLRPYNGFTKAEREAAARAIKRAIISGKAAEPTHCEICRASADEARLFKHLEDYREPMSYHGLCGRCHHHLHTRFWEPERWISLIEQRPRNWFHALSLDEVSRVRPFDETYQNGLPDRTAKVHAVAEDHRTSTEWALRGIPTGENSGAAKKGVRPSTGT